MMLLGNDMYNNSEDLESDCIIFSNAILIIIDS
jgi:hypothetical protein